MADPEIQAILQTPEVRNALSDLERDPSALNRIMSNRSLAEKIEKLIAAGILKMGWLNDVLIWAEVYKLVYQINYIIWELIYVDNII